MPASSQEHAFEPASPSSCRSPCPAINALANHGYLLRNRDGRAITALDIVRAMNEVYHVSIPLGSILSLVATGWCGSGLSLNLDDLAAHNKIEHDASIVRDNARPTDKYAPVTPNPELVKQFLAITGKGYLTFDDFVACRARRDATLTQPLSALHHFIAVGEMALTLQLFEDKEGRMSKEHLRAWFGEERLPVGWTLSNDQVLGIMGTSKLNKKIQDAVAEVKKKK